MPFSSVTAFSRDSIILATVLWTANPSGTCVAARVIALSVSLSTPVFAPQSLPRGSFVKFAHAPCTGGGVSDGLKFWA